MCPYLMPRLLEFHILLSTAVYDKFVLKINWHFVLLFVIVILQF